MTQSRAATSQRLYQRVVAEIERGLDEGLYPIGSRLPTERELAADLNVSRPTIREAMIALEVKGRVVVKMGSGVYVIEPASAPLSATKFSPFEVTEARVVLEGEAAALAAVMISEGEVEALREVYQEMVDENDRGDLTSEVADLKFHLIIAKATNNRWLLESIDSLLKIQQQSPEILEAHKSVCKQDGATRLKEHMAIIKAMEQRDPSAARKAMRSHFARGLKAMHDVSEAQEVERVRKEVMARRQRFSVNSLFD
ncbi:FadR/GntR family transcriptional regulator [Umboniibacter marinipuniceus]|uniref:GntR family transcriptional regulator n=1 Tax=Umboniibacter marinipuniceus TaxID=569599 RepID=A0A3M0ACT5_9GAMM|nr:FadR/GntR family transcriptional regulator [Umboniibacter marinipuniceus]RMA82287.1 GntR family transcriptional regulator [Umboniibacter marinipuniceus]